MASTSASEHLALIGLMGSGKSSVGRILADRLDRVLIDTDHQVEAATGRPIAELFVAQGEAAFRRYELQSLRRALARTEPVVVATGGGVVTTPDARRALKIDAITVWLRADPKVLAERLDGDRNRPLLMGRDPVEVLGELHRQRGPLYEQVASMVVDVDDLEPDQVADEVLTVLGWQP